MRIDQKTNERMERERACACESGQNRSKTKVARERAVLNSESKVCFVQIYIYIYETDPARRGLQFAADRTFRPVQLYRRETGKVRDAGACMCERRVAWKSGRIGI